MLSLFSSLTLTDPMLHPPATLYLASTSIRPLFPGPPVSLSHDARKDNGYPSYLRLVVDLALTVPGGAPRASFAGPGPLGRRVVQRVLEALLAWLQAGGLGAADADCWGGYMGFVEREGEGVGEAEGVAYLLLQVCRTRSPFSLWTVNWLTRVFPCADEDEGRASAGGGLQNNSELGGEFL